MARYRCVSSRTHIHCLLSCLPKYLGIEGPLTSIFNSFWIGFLSRTNQSHLVGNRKLVSSHKSVTASPLEALGSRKYPRSWAAAAHLHNWTVTQLPVKRKKIYHTWKTQASISSFAGLSDGDQPQNQLSINNQTVFSCDQPLPSPLGLADFQ